MAAISLLETHDYNERTVREAIARHFSILGADDLRPGMKVVVKPNLIMRCKPDRAATTHPAMIEAVVRHLQGMGITDIVIADSPGGLYTPQVLSAAYELTGYAEVARRCKITCNTACGSRELHVAEGRLCRSFDIIDPIADADYVINICKLKTHCMTTLSCGIKNLFGCIPGLLKPQLHYRFPDSARFVQMLIDLSLLIRPGLTIVDGIDAMEGDGPTGGMPRHVGITAAARGENFYALDLVMAHLIGLTPKEVPMLAEAVKRGLCPGNWQAVEILGDADAADRLAVPDFALPASKTLNFAGNVPGFLRPAVHWLEPHLASKPKIRTQDCIGCGKCAESCPAKTIAIAGRKASIDYSNCIRCFCCHEMCPVKAIDIKSPKVFHFFSKSKSD